MAKELDTHERFSGPRSKDITVEQSGLEGPNIRQNLEKLPPSQARDAELALLDKSVSFWFDNRYGKNSTIHAAVATGASNPATVYYRDFGVTTTLHENLHISTGLNDVDLADKLGLKHNGTTPSASEAISQGLKDNSCS